MKRILLYTLLALGAIVSFYPFLFMIGTAFKTLPESTAPTLRLFPAAWQWGNLLETFRAAPFSRYFFNSLVVSTTVAVAVMFTSLLAGYAFARLRFPGRPILFVLVLSTMMIPFEITFIPNFILVSRLGWYNTYAALIVPWCANAFSIFLMRQAFLTLPNDYFDAARVDGCGHLRFLAFIAVPLVKPSLATVGLFAFLGSYNALLWPMIVTMDDSMRVVQTGLTAFSSDAGVELNLLMCASAIVILPTVLLYFLVQRFLVENPIGAGIKG